MQNLGADSHSLFGLIPPHIMNTFTYWVHRDSRKWHFVEYLGEMQEEVQEQCCSESKQKEAPAAE